MAAPCAETHDPCQPIDTTSPTPYLIRNTAESCPVHALAMRSFLRVERYRDTKTVDDLPGKEETRATSSKKDKMIVALFKRNSTLRLREAKVKLAEKGLHVSINTIRHRLAEAKVQYRPTRQKPLLSEVHMENA